MTPNRTNPLLDAVDALTKDRTIHTVQPEGEYSDAETDHTETHPPLLVMLLEGTGQGRAGRTSDIRIPIDADALELWAQVRDLVRLWCKKLHVPFDDDLLASTRRWYIKHSNLVRSGQVSDVVDHDVTIMVEGWVRMIESKFDPPEKREWTDHCVADITHMDENGNLAHRKCGARRILINGVEEFAITLNVATLTAECRKCHHKWVGEKELAELRFLTNLDVAIRTGVTVDEAAQNLVTK